MKMQSMMIAGLAVLFGTIGVGSAEEPQDLKIEITPYAWLAGIEGDMSVRGYSVDFDKSFSDLFDAVEIGGSVRLGAEYNRFMVEALVDFFSLSTDELDVENQPKRGALDSKMLITEAAAGYRVDGWSEGVTFGLMAGVRNLHLENDLEVLNDGSFSREDDVTDAMFYVLPCIPVFPSKIEGLRFNPIMGIGAGESDLAYELFPQFQYQITDAIAVHLGYRTVGWQFEGDKNDNDLNISLSGLILGVGGNF